MSIFVKIVNNEIPSYKVYEDDLVLAFLDISQVTKGHTLVIPKVKYENIYDIPTKTLQHLIAVVQKLSIAINKAFNPLGLNLLNNNGSTAGQTVFHYHVHIIPRYSEGSIDELFINARNSKTTDEEYKNRAKLIASAL